jgi:hypothetical protein
LRLDRRLLPTLDRFLLVLACLVAVWVAMLLCVPALLNVEWEGAFCFPLGTQPPVAMFHFHPELDVRMQDLSWYQAVAQLTTLEKLN